MAVIKDPEANETKQLSSIKELAGARVLEIGCGDGRMTWRYAAYPRSIVAFDMDASRLADALAGLTRTPNRSVDFLQASGEAIPLANESFEVAILSWSL